VTNSILVALKMSAQRALLGMIYPSIRAIAVGIQNNNTIKIVYYLDKLPDNADYESISEVSAEMLADFKLNSIDEVCEYSLMPISQLNCLDCWVYIRQELSSTKD
jgi:hypothetical protein